MSQHLHLSPIVFHNSVLPYKVLNALNSSILCSLNKNKLYWTRQRFQQIFIESCYKSIFSSIMFHDDYHSAASHLSRWINYWFAKAWPNVDVFRINGDLYHCQNYHSGREQFQKDWLQWSSLPPRSWRKNESWEFSVTFREQLPLLS